LHKLRWQNVERPLVTIVGPTASGKSELALRLAAAFSGEIVNCDALQLYQGFDIGTAKTPPDARSGIPHHLVDALAPQTSFSAGDYARAARQIIAEISARGHLPLVVGGSGFYLRGLIRGLPALPGRDEFYGTAWRNGNGGARVRFTASSAGWKHPPRPAFTRTMCRRRPAPWKFGCSHARHCPRLKQRRL
jgi:hypothetical protein